MTTILNGILQDGGKILADIVLGSDASSFDANNLTGIYKVLKIYLTVRTDRAGQSQDELVMTFNADTTDANYQRTMHYAGGGHGISDKAAIRSLGDIPANNSSAGDFALFEGTIFDYARTDKNKIMTYTLSEVETAGGVDYIYNGFQRWASTNAITRIQVTPGLGTNFKTGSHLLIMGF